MSQVWFTSDLHFGHKNIGTFRDRVNDSEGNTALIRDDWERCVSKRDTVWMLGDIAFDDEGFRDVRLLPGTKNLVLGNHDTYPIRMYAAAFNKVKGLARYKNSWLSHSPIHPEELRGKKNLHGHVHRGTLDDERYFNCCVDNLWKVVDRSLISLDELRKLGVL